MLKTKGIITDKDSGRIIANIPFKDKERGYYANLKGTGMSCVSDAQILGAVTHVPEIKNIENMPREFNVTVFCETEDNKHVKVYGEMRLTGGLKKDGVTPERAFQNIKRIPVD